MFLQPHSKHVHCPSRALPSIMSNPPRKYLPSANPCNPGTSRHSLCMPPLPHFPATLAHRDHQPPVPSPRHSKGETRGIPSPRVAGVIAPNRQLPSSHLSRHTKYVSESFWADFARVLHGNLQKMEILTCSVNASPIHLASGPPV